MNYVVVAVLFAVAQASSPVSKQDSRPPAAPAQGPRANSNKAPAAPSPPPVDANAPPDHVAIGKEQRTDDAQHSISISNIPPVRVAPPRRDWADWGYWGFNLLLVVVGAAQAGLLYGTLRAIRRQACSMRHQTTHLRRSVIFARRTANAARKSAEAALLNAQAVINSERPWIFLEQSESAKATDPKKALVRILGKNKGRTPAEISVISCDFKWIPYGWEYPDDPKYANEELLYKKYIAANDEPFEVYEFACSMSVTDEIWEDVTARKERLTFIGHVVYRDLITKEEHETRFCYFLSPVPMIGLVMTGPRNYNQHI